MISIYREGPDGRRGYNFRRFETEFLQICEEHKRDGRALFFAFLLFDFRNADLVKVLRDEDYWRALDVTSGNRLTVYSFHVLEPKVPAPTVEVRNMYAVDPGPSHRTELVFRSYFGTLDVPAVPAVLFFQVNEESVSDYFIVTLSARGVEGTYQELEDVLDVAVRSVAKVLPENEHRAGEVFNLVKAGLDERTLRARIAKGLKVLGPIKELVNFLGVSVR
ncbi:MAG: hypothetical protein ACREQV_05595 [Candidatus Binatia bacterium]